MKNQKGFTLIELIIVIAIIGILAIMAYPNLKAYKDRNTEAERQKVEYIVNKALKQYYALEGKYPQISQGNIDSSNKLKVEGSNNGVKELSDMLGITLNWSDFEYVYDNSQGKCTVNEPKE